MRRTFFVFGILGLAVVLAACAPAATPTQAPRSNQVGGNFGNGGGNGPRTLNTETKLAIGLLKLEGTANAVTADEARTLLPLWQQIKTMNADPNTAAADLTAVYTQIQGDLSADQTSAIDQLNLTQADMQSMMQQLGITFPQGGNPNGGNNGGTPFPTLSADERATRAAQRQTQVASGTSQAPNGTPGAGFGGGRGGFGNVFIDPIITLLQTRAGG